MPSPPNKTATSSANAPWPSGPLLLGLLTHCRSQYPEEACGLWSRTTDGLWQLHPLSNHSPQPERYRRFAIDPLDLLPLLEAEDAGDITIHGLYHSHPDQSASLSSTDQESLQIADRPAYPTWRLIVVGLPHTGPATLSLYSWETSSRRYENLDTIDEMDIT